MSDAERLRPHPQERFAGEVQVFDLTASAGALRAEPHEAVEGHRQLALYRHGPVTLLLFLFDSGASLPEHQYPGLVTVQALRGAFRVQVPGVEIGIRAGQIASVAPGVPYCLVADDAADALVTMHLNEDA